MARTMTKPAANSRSSKFSPHGNVNRSKPEETAAKLVFSYLCGKIPARRLPSRLAGGNDAYPRELHDHQRAQFLCRHPGGEGGRRATSGQCPQEADQERIGDRRRV